MTDTKKTEKSALKTDPAKLLQEMKEFSLTVGEECPEGHRRDARSGACLPIGSTDHTAFTRSLNDDQGDRWRGLEDKPNETFASELKELALMDAGDMDEPVSCGEGTTFSFVKRSCVSLEEAEVENSDELEAEVADDLKPSEEPRMKQPEGRRDTPNHECPPSQIFDYKRRECIPLNKDTVMASEDNVETAAPIKTKQRNALPSSSFGVPGKRKFPLDSCNRVRNAMARFNQAKGLTAAEKATLRRKIHAAAKKCGIEVKKFASATTTEEFATVMNELLLKERIVTQYAAKDEENKDSKKGPCPPWMSWDPKAKKCGKMKGFHEIIKSQGQATNADPSSKDPAGRKDTPGFKCPSGEFFDFKNRKCLPLDPANKEGRQPGDTTKAAQDDVVPLAEGKPARLPSDCGKGLIWDAKLKRCIPLDSGDKVDLPVEGANVEEAQVPWAGPGKDSHGCGPGEYFDAKSEKCKKGSNKAEVEVAGREGLVPAPAGKVKLPEDCPEGTLWDGINKLCRPIDSRDKNRPSGSKGPQSPKDTADVEELSVAQLIKTLDEIIKSNAGQKEKMKLSAKELPNEAFPPSLVSSTRRSLMHHTSEVADAYDNETVDVSRLRNALARVDKVEGHSAPAVEDARNHLLYHAREIVKAHLGKN